MTIGVAACGPNAGAAVRAAVLGAELLGRGAIGGFAVFAVLDEQGSVGHRVSQRGGINALELPESWLRARHAAVISSGPDRPEPLVQFLPGTDRMALVTGHRSPHLPGRGGVPVNRLVINRIAAGASPQEAVDATLEENPESDAGLIALDIHGRLGWGNTRRVLRREDKGSCHRDNGEARLALLHNSIPAYTALAESVADLAWNCLTGQAMPTRFLHLRESVPIRPSDRDRVHIRDNGDIVAIDSADPLLPSANRRGWAVYLGTEVWQGERLIGHAASELSIEIAQGRVFKSPTEPPAAVVMQAEHQAGS
jgi:hypothetical protein